MNEHLPIRRRVGGAIDHAECLDRLPILSEICFTEAFALLGSPAIQDVNSTRRRPRCGTPQRTFCFIQSRYSFQYCDKQRSDSCSGSAVGPAQMACQVTYGMPRGRACFAKCSIAVIARVLRRSAI